jgi:hypothetical protein
MLITGTEREVACSGKYLNLSSEQFGILDNENAMTYSYRSHARSVHKPKMRQVACMLQSLKNGVF